VAVAGFRDVIDEPDFVRDAWEREEVYDVLRSLYRRICVYGDPLMVDFAASYGLDSELSAKLRYCGYLGRRNPAATDTPLYERPLVIANGGGGVDGAQLLEAFVGAARRLCVQRGGTWLMVTGPMMDDDAHDRFARDGEAAGLMIRRTVPDLRAHIALADCVVSMAGYNTCCDLLTFRRPGILVPRHGPNREQMIRAERFDEWGIAKVVPAHDADSGRLEHAIATALDGDQPPPAPVPLGGLDAATDAFALALVASGTPRGVNVTPP
jgi:predicted glycosyltransferase